MQTNEKQAQLVVVNDAALIPPKDIATFRKLATDALQLHAKAVKAYWQLCVFIRDNQMTPEVVTTELTARGYQESRVSEIKRVAFCAPALFEEYRKGVIGFRFALAAARADEKREPEDRTNLPPILKGEAKLRAEMIDALQSIIPLKGPLPLLLRYRFPVEVNGYRVTINVKKIKQPKKK